MSNINITPQMWNISGSTYQPGDRLILAAGTRNEIEFHDLKGTAQNPIVVTTAGKTIIQGINPGGRVVQFINCSFVRFTGGSNCKLAGLPISLMLPLSTSVPAEPPLLRIV